MNLDINEVVGDMAEAIKGSLTGDWPDAKRTVKKFLERRQERLKLIAELLFDGTLDQETVKPYLENEKELLKMELLGISIISKAMAQNAANKALEVLGEALKAAL